MRLPKAEDPKSSFLEEKRSALCHLPGDWAKFFSYTRRIVFPRFLEPHLIAPAHAPKGGFEGDSLLFFPVSRTSWAPGRTCFPPFNVSSSRPSSAMSGGTFWSGMSAPFFPIGFFPCLSESPETSFPVYSTQVRHLRFLFDMTEVRPPSP